LGPEVLADLKIGKEEQATHETTEMWGQEGRWPIVIVHGHIKEGV